jgi:hypothetical protein
MVMTTWIATFSHDLNPDQLKDLEVDAVTKEQAEAALEAKLATLSKCSIEWQSFSLLNLRPKRGGVRPGAGRKKGTQGTYGCATKVVRVPTEIAPKLPELLINLEQLKQLLEDWEEESLKSTSPRYDRAKRLITEIRALGF